MDRIKELEKEIKKHKKLYYQGTPEISDLEFDKLEDELKKLSPEHPVLSLVGSETINHDKVKHDKKMLSLGKTYDVNELLSWMKDYEVISVFKIDGVSCSIIYKNGILDIAKTRGDGQFGENITNKVKWMNNVPKLISSNEEIEIRGEMYIDEESFFKLSEEMVKQGLDKPTSQRNIVAGLVGRKENIELCNFIKFKAFDVIGLEFEKETEKYKYLEKNHFDIPEVKNPKNKKEVEEVINEAKEFMTFGNFQIDGLVFVYNKIALHEELGETAHHPRYKMAFKFPGETKQAILKEITWQVSRNGILTPVGEIEPTELSGAVVSRVTLHNYGMVKQHELTPGSKIELIRSGEVIPKFLSVVEKSDTVFTIPEYCPSCGQKIFIEDIRLICRNEFCPDQIKETILNFVQKIGIEDISGKRLEEMIKSGLVKSIEDLYKLGTEDFLKLDKVKDKLANKFTEEINKSKSVDLITFLSSLGLTGGAYNKCEKIVNAGFNTIEKILAMRVEDLVAVDGFAEKSASEIVNSLKEKSALIQKLISLGFDIQKGENTIASDGPLLGMKICITGALSEKRSVVEDRIKKLGGSTVGSVSKNTSMLLTNETDPSSSKFKKALELGIKIISEEELFKL